MGSLTQSSRQDASWLKEELRLADTVSNKRTAFLCKQGRGQEDEHQERRNERLSKARVAMTRKQGLNKQRIQR